MTFPPSVDDEGRVPLLLRERVMLHMLGDGLTVSAISQRCGIPRAQVASTVDGALRKLADRTDPELRFPA